MVLLWGNSGARPASPDRALLHPLSRVSPSPADPASGMAGLSRSVTIPRARKILNPSPGAVGPASRLRRRYADAPAAALLTGLGAGEWPALRSSSYAHFYCLFEVRGLRPLFLKERHPAPKAVKATHCRVENGGPSPKVANSAEFNELSGNCRRYPIHFV